MGGNDQRGVTQLAPYISTGKSGLTVGQGVDIGYYGNVRGLQNSSTFTCRPSVRIWQSDPNLAFFASFSGVEHAQAIANLQASRWTIILHILLG